LGIVQYAHRLGKSCEVQEQIKHGIDYNNKRAEGKESITDA